MKVWACLLSRGCGPGRTGGSHQEARGGCDGRLLLHLQGGQGDGRLLREWAGAGLLRQGEDSEDTVTVTGGGGHHSSLHSEAVTRPPLRRSHQQQQAVNGRGRGCSAQPHRTTQSLLAATALLTSALSLSPVVVGLTILCLHYHLLLLCLNITPAMTRVFTIYIINKISEFSTVYMW